MRKQGTEPERWHWVYTAAIFRLDQRGHTAANRPVISERGDVATHKSNGGQQVLGALKELMGSKANLTPTQREKLAKEIGYFITHAHRINCALSNV